MNALSPQAPSPPELGALIDLDKAVSKCRSILNDSTVTSPLIFFGLFNQIRKQLHIIFGPDSEIVKRWPSIPLIRKTNKSRDLLVANLPWMEQLNRSFQDAQSRALAGSQDQRIFIGHGRSPVWRELKDFLSERLGLHWEEFNRESVPGIPTTERLQKMLETSTFAFIVMTAEDEHADTKIHARANVIHEAGLFQGRLGPRRAIILLEEGCEQFSNIHGLTHIPFPREHVNTAFEEIRRVLERENMIAA